MEGRRGRQGGGLFLQCGGDGVGVNWDSKSDTYTGQIQVEKSLLKPGETSRQSKTVWGEKKNTDCRTVLPKEEHVQ